MAAAPPVPLAEAIERLGRAAQAYLDGPLAHLRASAERAGQPGYDGSRATVDAATYGLHLAQAWWGGFNALVDATAILAISPGAGHLFDIPLPSAVATPSTVRVVDQRWTSVLRPEPAGAVVQVLPPVILAVGATQVCLYMRARANHPAWEARLEITPVGATQGVLVLARLDDDTERL